MKNLILSSVLTLVLGSQALANDKKCVMGKSGDIWQTEVTLHMDSNNYIVERITVQEIVRGQPSGLPKTFAVEMINNYFKGHTYKVRYPNDSLTGILDNFIGKSSIYVNLLSGPSGTGMCE